MTHPHPAHRIAAHDQRLSAATAHLQQIVARHQAVDGDERTAAELETALLLAMTKDPRDVAYLVLAAVRQLGERA